MHSDHDSVASTRALHRQPSRLDLGPSVLSTGYVSATDTTRRHLQGLEKGRTVLKWEGYHHVYDNTHGPIRGKPAVMQIGTAVPMSTQQVACQPSAPPSGGLNTWTLSSIAEEYSYKTPSQSSAQLSNSSSTQIGCRARLPGHEECRNPKVPGPDDGQHGTQTRSDSGPFH
ncbi:uncharacterized protein B0I36DRAFT_134085 [Microdochium trichocladiopsis]|uniref:Uncharacterized protein n=1 Tax=Microdochium trichocladiopsis TaxID=1682393 RepID=A0A9P9BPX9_9PEZI|nr:uncharacterized protein B0I36DRAFT_134085 [Microdochium trichocladiopsis]KAH7029605.1 hypothetical protein B0I36DRAFT_134085 [Microdochium trichocladiopsis]